MSIAIVSSLEKLRWVSMNEIIPAVEKAWLKNQEARLYRIDPAQPSHWPENVEKITKKRLVVFTAINSVTARMITLLRSEFRSNATFAIHLHGDGTTGGLAFAPFARFLTTKDTFVAASRADARATKLCFTNARIAIVPFALSTEKTLSRSHYSSSQLRLIYAGRIAEQKNLHTLLRAVALVEQQKPGCFEALDIYGSPDMLGNRNMGKPGNAAYQTDLMNLEKQLGLSKLVRWHGFLERDQLKKKLASTPHVFVSTSLHTDENFGAAAFASLAQGAKAVLTAWGGHLDFARNFKEQVSLVPVLAGPKVSPEAFAKALFEVFAKRQKPRKKPTNFYATENVSLQLKKIAARELQTKAGQSLKESTLSRKILDRRAEKKLTGFQVFESYEDPLIQPFLSVYGMRPRV